MRVFDYSWLVRAQVTTWDMGLVSQVGTVLWGLCYLEESVSKLNSIVGHPSGVRIKKLVGVRKYFIFGVRMKTSHFQKKKMGVTGKRNIKCLYCFTTRHLQLQECKSKKASR